MFSRVQKFELAKEPKDFREIIRAEFTERNRVCASYSLRQFARDLGMSASLLSAVLSGKNSLSPRMARQVSERMQLDESRTEFFCDLVSAEGARSGLQRRAAEARLRRRA